jgi:hypothetical protein
MSSYPAPPAVPAAHPHLLCWHRCGKPSAADLHIQIYLLLLSLPARSAIRRHVLRQLPGCICYAGIFTWANHLPMFRTCPAAVTASMSRYPVPLDVAAAPLHLLCWHMHFGESSSDVLHIQIYLLLLSLPACPAAWCHLLWQLPVRIWYAGISSLTQQQLTHLQLQQQQQRQERSYGHHHHIAHSSHSINARGPSSSSSRSSSSSSRRVHKVLATLQTQKK